MSTTETMFCFIASTCMKLAEMVDFGPSSEVIDTI